MRDIQSSPAILSPEFDLHALFINLWKFGMRRDALSADVTLSEDV